MTDSLLNVTIKGTPELLAKFRKVAESVQGDLLMTAAEVGATVLIAEAKRLCPVAPDGGNLRSSITSAPASSTPTRATVDIGPGTQAPYGKYIEFGTGIYAEGGKGRKTPWTYFHPKYGFITTKGSVAQPFLRPPLVTQKKETERVTGEALWRQLEGAAR